MKKIDGLTQKYTVSKTIRFRLIPQGKTEENFRNNYLRTDCVLADSYKKIKRIIIDYHRKFIDDSLTDLKLNKDHLSGCYTAYKQGTKDQDKEKALKGEITKAFENNENYKNLFGKEMVTKLLPEFVQSDKEIVEKFAKFTTYLRGFYENVKNIYSNKGKSTEITFRLINQNLYRFFDNCKIGEMLQNNMPDLLQKLQDNLPKEICPKKIEDFFNPIYYNNVITGKGIDCYNQLIGGYSQENGDKIKGINEYINEYNQSSDKKMPRFKQLYKQILSEGSTLSFLPEKFEQDAEVISAINDYCEAIKGILERIPTLFDSQVYDYSKIFIRAEKLSAFSQKLTGEWNIVRDLFYADYDKNATDKQKKSSEKYEENRRKYFAKKTAYTLQEIFDITSNEISKEKFAEKMTDALTASVKEIKEKCQEFAKLSDKSKLLGDDDNTGIVKDYLDSLISLKDIFSVFNADMADKDNSFYGVFDDIVDTLSGLIPLYNKTRNYLTKKAYSTDKLKLTFGFSQLFNGWSASKEKVYHTILLRKDKKYYVGIVGENEFFNNIVKAIDGEAYTYQKMVYNYLPNPNKSLPHVIFANNNKELFYNSECERIYKIYKDTSYKNNKEDLHVLIDYFKECIGKYPAWEIFGFNFSDTESYERISDFYKEVAAQGYKVSFEDVSGKYIDDCVRDGTLYLFEIYSKDFSDCSKGKKNLHTLLFEQLFRDNNPNRPLLNGGAEMFYRCKSIEEKDIIKHKKNIPILAKSNSAKTSVFEYDLIKDKRYTEDRFLIHIPITMNPFVEGERDINTAVRKAISGCENNYIIGIDRGERNLLYISVIDENGNIVEQRSLNVIKNEYDGNHFEINYHDKLSDREAERDRARKSWKSITGIADLKRGYLSQAVYEICRLVQKYDAVIALENLNAGFKNSRKKYELSVYQEIEKSLTDKLGYLTFKDIDSEECGGINNAYQLVNNKATYKNGSKYQNGIIFYVTPSWTSKIDPVTGFADLLQPKYVSQEKTRELIKAFDTICYCKDEDLFKFHFDYSRLPTVCNKSAEKEWTVYSYGDRIKSYKENGQWKKEKVESLTEVMKELLDKYGISYQDGGDIRNKLTQPDKADFYKHFIYVLSLISQMRNSDKDKDYIISPVKDKDGMFFDSRKPREGGKRPCDADANGAYNIARKALLSIKKIKEAGKDRSSEAMIAVSDAEWFCYLQGKEQNNKSDK